MAKYKKEGYKNMNYRKILEKQLAADFNVDLEMLGNAPQGRNNLFTERKDNPGSRKFRDNKPLLKVLSYRNQLVISCGDKDLLKWCRQEYQDFAGEWFSKVENLRKLDKELGQYGHQIRDMHHYFIPDEQLWKKFAKKQKEGHIERDMILKKEIMMENSPYKLIWYRGEEELEQFRGDKRFEFALSFDENAADMMAIVAQYVDKSDNYTHFVDKNANNLAKVDNSYMAMAGASADSSTMWQIGIDVMQRNRSKGIATILTKQMTKACLEIGVLPFYGTAESHNMSNAIAIRCGYTPGWWELCSEKIE